MTKLDLCVEQMFYLEKAPQTFMNNGEVYTVCRFDYKDFCLYKMVFNVLLY